MSDVSTKFGFVVSSLNIGQQYEKDRVNVKLLI